MNEEYPYAVEARNGYRVALFKDLDDAEFFAAFRGGKVVRVENANEEGA